MCVCMFTYVSIQMYTYTHTHIFSRAFGGINECENVFVPISYLPNPSARAGYDTRSTF